MERSKHVLVPFFSLIWVKLKSWSHIRVSFWSPYCNKTNRKFVIQKEKTGLCGVCWRMRHQFFTNETSYVIWIRLIDRCDLNFSNKLPYGMWVMVPSPIRWVEGQDTRKKFDWPIEYQSVWRRAFLQRLPVEQCCWTQHCYLSSFPSFVSRVFLYVVNRGRSSSIHPDQKVGTRLMDELSMNSLHNVSIPSLRFLCELMDWLRMTLANNGCALSVKITTSSV